VAAQLSQNRCKWRGTFTISSWELKLGLVLVKQPHIPYTEGVDTLALFSDDAQIAAWNNEGLPMDRMSTENATILQYSTRWPLMIDPQL